MKRTAIILLALIMALSLVACGETVKEQNAKISRGTLTGDVYNSTFSGLTFTKPSDWVFSSDAEIAQMMNVGADVLDQTKFEQTIAETVTVYDMMAKNNLTGSNVIIAYENLSLSGVSSESAYLNALKTQLEAQTAVSYNIGSTSTVTVSGKSFSALEATAEYNGVTMTQAYYVRKIDGFMVNIIVTAVGEDTAQSILAMFS